MKKQNQPQPDKFKPLQVVRVAYVFGADPNVLKEGDIVAIVGREDYEGVECYRVTKPGMSRPYLLDAHNLEAATVQAVFE